MPKFRDWVAGRTAVTIADDDELYVRDDDADESKRITWANVKTALGSTYAPRSEQRAYLWAQDFGVTPGSAATLTRLGDSFRLWSLPSGSFSGIAAPWLPPPGWTTFDAFVWWTNLGAGSGDFPIKTRIGRQFWDIETVVPSATSVETTTIAAPATNVLLRTQCVTDRSVAAGTSCVTIERGSGDTTPSNAIGILGVEIVRVS